jgi:hypothetical protein
MKTLLNILFVWLLFYLNKNLNLSLLAVLQCYTLVIRCTHPSEEPLPWFESKSNLGSLGIYTLCFFGTNFRIPEASRIGRCRFCLLEAGAGCFSLVLKVFLALRFMAYCSIFYQTFSLKDAVHTEGSEY